MTNELETITGYLEWADADIDKSPEAYVRHLEDEANRVTVQTVLNNLTKAQGVLDNMGGDVDIAEARKLNSVETLVNESVNVLMGDHEYIDIRTLSGESTIVRTA